MKMLIPWGKAIGFLTLLAVIGFGLGLGGMENPQLVEDRVPAILKVCMGCTYGSIQAAVDAAQPGDTVEAHLPYIVWVFPMQPWVVKKVTIPKPLTLEAKPFTIADISLEVAVLSSQGSDPIFDVTAETGQVTIRGFVLMGGGISWSGKADLLLEHNRFESFGQRWSPKIGLRGRPGRAVLQNNEIKEGDIEMAPLR